MNSSLRVCRASPTRLTTRQTVSVPGPRASRSTQYAALHPRKVQNKLIWKCWIFSRRCNGIYLYPWNHKTWKNYYYYYYFFLCWHPLRVHLKFILLFTYTFQTKFYCIWALYNKQELSTFQPFLDVPLLYLWDLTLNQTPVGGLGTSHLFFCRLPCGSRDIIASSRCLLWIGLACPAHAYTDIMTS